MRIPFLYSFIVSTFIYYVIASGARQSPDFTAATWDCFVPRQPLLDNCSTLSPESFYHLLPCKRPALFYYLPSLAVCVALITYILVRIAMTKKQNQHIIRHCERSVALILPGAKLNVFKTAWKVNYMDVIYNLWTSLPLPEIASSLAMTISYIWNQNTNSLNTQRKTSWIDSLLFIF